LDVKLNRGRTFVVVDAGMNDLLRPALYGAFHRIEPVTLRGRADVRVDVVGPVCETADFLARDRDLPAVVPGELLAVRDAGAYGFAMSSTYNMRPRAAEALVEEGTARLIRRRETFEDLTAAEVRQVVVATARGLEVLRPGRDLADGGAYADAGQVVADLRGLGQGRREVRPRGVHRQQRHVEAARVPGLGQEPPGGGAVKARV